LALPRWLVAGLLGLGLLSLVYFTAEPVLRSRLAIWLLVIAILALDAGAALHFGGQSVPFFIINNAVQVVAVVGATNLWAQSGLKARDTAIFGVALAAYDYLFTSILSLMMDLFGHLAGLPFAPLVAWPVSSAGGLSIGLGDLLLAAVFPLVMRKAFGRMAGLAAIATALGTLAGLIGLALSSLLAAMFPVMVLLGPLMALQYLYWRRRRPERTTRQYLQVEPMTVEI
jgi:hypothetical protein